MLIDLSLDTGGRYAYSGDMIEILRSNNLADIAFSQALLQSLDIECHVFDVHMSVLEGSIGILPQRVMVATKDATRAREALHENDLPVSE